jgi:tyrosinase
VPGLAPFHSDNGTTLWTSDGVRNTSTFSYTYPELVDWNVSAAELTSNVRLAVNKLYNQGALSTTDDSSTTTQLSPRGLTRSARASAFHNITFANAKSLNFNNLPMSWTISIVVQRYAYPVPFLIDLFMGVPEPDPALRSTASNLIGSHTTLFSGNATEIFPNGAPDILMQGYVSLSHTLAAGVVRGVLANLRPESVVPVLTEMLMWNARGVDGRDIELAGLAGLSVRVSSRVVRPARHGREFPRYGSVQWWDGVVRGKVGGG